AGVQGGCRGRADQRASARARERAAQAGCGRAPDPDARGAGGRPTRAGESARVQRRWRGEALLHAPADRGARRAAPGARGLRPPSSPNFIRSVYSSGDDMITNTTGQPLAAPYDVNDNGKLDPRERRALPDSAFALPSHRELPLVDAELTREAISGLS